MHGREPTSFSRENAIAAVIPTSCFSDFVVVAKTSHHMLGVLSLSDRERASPPATEISVLTFVVKKKDNEAFRGVYFKRIGEKT